MMQRLVKALRGTQEAGYLAVELTVTVAIMGLLAVTMMPALAGYQQNNAMRNAAAQALYQFRAAEMMSITDNVTMQVLFEPTDAYQAAGWSGPGWEICAGICGNAGVAVLFKTVLPASLNVTASCYRQRFYPQGYANWCSGLPATTNLICIDNKGTPTPSAIEVRLVLATSALSAREASGNCNNLS